MINVHHDLYLKWDVLLLADVFEKLRNNSLWIIADLLFERPGFKLGCNA